MAFSIDLGYIVAVRSELQNAADAAALSAAQQLQTYFVQFYMPGQADQQTIYNNATTDVTTPTAPIPTAQRFAGTNQAGNVPVTVSTSDVTFSYYDGSTFSACSSPDHFPNTVNVTTRRDSNANGSLVLFFAKLLGFNSMDLTATASATIYAGDVATLQSIPGVNAHILPVALDINVWTNYMQANTSSDWLIGLLSVGPNNALQLQVYPFDTNTPGSFGLLDVGLPANNVPAFRIWINNGETPNDITYLLNNNLLPVSPTAPELWKVGPGL
jgi:Flp pilus assembly protein TadG